MFRSNMETSLDNEMSFFHMLFSCSHAFLFTSEIHFVNANKYQAP